jgi:sialate O-acetylesterase
MKWARPDFDDSNWESIKVPSAWEDQGFYGYDGYAWYRTTFLFAKDMRNKDLYLNLGYIDDVDEVFVNGRLIGFSGTFPPRFSTGFEARRKYPIPEEYLNLQGKNVIAVRVYNHQLAGGILSGDIGISWGNVKPDFSILGLWMFKTGDNKLWKGYDCKDKQWKKIIVPGNWENQGYIDYDGFAWYRRHFVLPEDLINQKLVLVLGKVNNIEEVYINGVLIGSSGKMPQGNGKVKAEEEPAKKCRSYVVPEDLIIPNKDNIIAIRVFNIQQRGGIVEGPVGFAKQVNFNRYFKDLTVSEN